MSKQLTYTSPGKLGDALHQFPIIYWNYRETGEIADLWMDEKTCKLLVPLFSAQQGIKEVELKGGVENYSCGGQPWHMSLRGKYHTSRYFVHLGLRSFPQRQLTLECLERVALPLKVDPKDLAETPCLTVEPAPKSNRLILHGMGICPHTRQTPGFWRFLSNIRKELESEFEEIVFVGSDADREIGVRVYPQWAEWSDHGDFAKLGSYINASRAMIGCGSAPVVLAGLLCVPAIRVHDPIGEAPKIIWSNLGQNQLNATESELRTAWPAWRDQWLKQEAAVEHH